MEIIKLVQTPHGACFTRRALPRIKRNSTVESHYNKTFRCREINNGASHKKTCAPNIFDREPLTGRDTKMMGDIRLLRHACQTGNNLSFP